MSKNLDKDSKIKKIPKRGEIWLIKCDKIKEFSKAYRPGLVISSDEQNEFDDFIVVAMMTTVTLKKGSSEVLKTSSDDLENVQLFEVFIKSTPETGLDESSKIILNHPFTVFRDLRLEKKLGKANRETMEKVKKAWKVAFDVEDW